MPLHPYVALAIDAARAAGDLIVRYVANSADLQIRTKGDNIHDLVTNIDLQAQDLITNKISKLYSRHRIIAEEGSKSRDLHFFDQRAEREDRGGSERLDRGGAERPDRGRFDSAHTVTWVIDPIDGTMNFVHGLGHFCVAIAIFVGMEIQHAVVYAPVSEELFVASKGMGAKLNGRRIRVSNCPNLQRALLATAFPGQHGQSTSLRESLNLFTDIMGKCSDVRRLGSAALDLAYLAAGRLDGYWSSGLKPWDLATGLLLVKEAGGFVSDYAGGNLMLSKGEIIAGTPKVYTQLAPFFNTSDAGSAAD